MNCMVVVLGILLGVAIALLIPLAADKVWKCNEDERVMATADKEVRLFYPEYTNTNWEYFQKPEVRADGWEDVG